MIRECFRCDTGIIFDAAMLQQLGIGVDMDRRTLLPVPQRIPGDKQIDGPPPPKPSLLSGIAKFFGFGRTSAPKDKMLSVPGRGHNTPYVPPDHVHEAEEEWRDARSPMHDQLKSNWWLWLLMEWIPWRIKKNHAILEETNDLNSYEWMYVILFLNLMDLPRVTADVCSTVGTEDAVGRSTACSWTPE